MISMSPSSPSTRLIRRVWLLPVAALLVTACSPPEAAPEPPPDTPSTPSSVSTTPAPTPEEVASAEAVEAFEDYWQLRESVRQAPAARDWEPELLRYADEQITAVDLDEIAFMLEYQVKQTGVSTVEPENTEVDLSADPGPTASITVCYDGSATDTVFVATGESSEPTDTPEIQRWKLFATVIQYEQRPGSPWLVHDVVPQTETPC